MRQWVVGWISNIGLRIDEQPGLAFGSGHVLGVQVGAEILTLYLSTESSERENLSWRTGRCSRAGPAQSVATRAMTVDPLTRPGRQNPTAGRATSTSPGLHRSMTGSTRSGWGEP